ncbi:MAG: ankyrin repeat domain-containing protein [Pseudomonadota bacterium]
MIKGLNQAANAPTQVLNSNGIGQQQPRGRVESAEGLNRPGNSSHLESVKTNHTISTEILNGLQTMARPITKIKNIAEILKKIDEVYGAATELTCHGQFSGDALDRRILAKAYGYALLDFIKNVASKDEDIALEGVMLGRIPESEIVDATNDGSRIQAIVLMLDKIPFYLLNVGSNTELSVVIDNSFFNLGCYRSEKVDKAHLSVVSLENRNLGYEVFISNKKALKDINTFNASEAQSVLKIKNKAVRLVCDQMSLKNDIFAELLASEMYDEDDPLFSSTVNKMNQYRAICDLTELQLYESPNLFRDIQNLHNATIISNNLFQTQDNKHCDIDGFISAPYTTTYTDLDEIFLSAIESGDLVKAKRLLGNININTVDKFGNSALFSACYAGNTEIINFLVKNNADVNHKNNKGITPLIAAAHSNNPETVRCLIYLNADVQASINWAKNQTNPISFQSIINLLEEELCRFQFQQRQSLIHVLLSSNVTPIVIAKRVDEFILSNDLSNSFNVQLDINQIDKLRSVLENSQVFTRQQADQLEAIHVDWQALFKGLEGLNDQQKLYFQAFASGLSQAYLLSKIIPSGMLEVINPGDTHLEHAGWDAAKAAMTMAMPKLVRGAEKIASEIPFAGLAVSGATSLYLYHMETKVHNRQVLISECVINELSMNLFANKLARSLVAHSSYQTLLSELNDKALEQKNPQRFRRLIQVKNTVIDGLEKFNLKARSEFNNPIGYQAIQDVAQVLMQMGKHQALRSALQNQQTDDAVAIMCDLLIDPSTANVPSKLSLVQTTTSQTILHSYTSTQINSNSQPNVDPKEFAQMKEQLSTIAATIEHFKPNESTRRTHLTGLTERDGNQLKLKLVQIKKVQEDIKEAQALFGDRTQGGVDIETLMTRVINDLDGLLKEHIPYRHDFAALLERMDEIENIALKTREDIQSRTRRPSFLNPIRIQGHQSVRQLEKIVVAQQQEINALKESNSELQNQMQSFFKQSKTDSTH